MCGIVGYYGENVFENVFDVLERLEYRGYDSAGIAIYNGNIYVKKDVGSVKDLFKKVDKIDGKIGIGHTRWATHGEIRKENAHPFVSMNKKHVIVHNGIIENFLDIKEELMKKGYKFESQTDSEVIANFLENFENVEEGIISIFNKFKGDYAVVGFTSSGILYGFKKGEPLVLGVGDGKIVISSDPNSISHLVKKIAYLDDWEGFIVKNGNLRFISKKGEIKKKFFKVNSKYVIKKLNEYTLKEIIEEKEIRDFDYKIDFDDFEKIIFTGAGSSYNASLFGSLLFLSKGINSFSILSSEFSNYLNLIDDKTLVVAISQSGETKDTINAVNLSKKRNATIYSIVNVPNSTLDRISDKSFYMNVGPEIGVVATKSFFATLKILLSFVNLNYEANNFSFKKLLPIARILSKVEHVYVIGSGIGFPIAREGALKIKEISYVHAEAFESGELKHGNIALIEKGTPVIGIVSDDRVIQNLIEVKSRGALVIGISKEYDKIFDFWMKANNPLEWVVPFQILGYEMAKIRGLNPDRPRNLAKSVTVV